MLRWLEKRLGFLAVPNVTLFLICGQVLTFLAAATEPSLIEQMALFPDRVRDGEVWRLLTFMFMAPVLDPNTAWSSITIVLFIIQLQILWLFGRTLEADWGTLRYNLFLLTGYLATVAAAFLIEAVWRIPIPATNAFLFGTVFLAFAFRYPDFVMRLFFILPIRIKWLALAAWIAYAALLVFGNGMIRILVLSSVLNWFLYFWRDVLGLMRVKGRKLKRQAKSATAREDAFHRCVVCGRTDATHPKVEFRYARTAEGVKCYCQDHLPGTASACA